VAIPGDPVRAKWVGRSTIKLILFDTKDSGLCQLEARTWMGSGHSPFGQARLGLISLAMA
jgi:hypothetical protein